MMMMVSEQKIDEMQNTLNYFVREVNMYRLQGDYKNANDYLSMLLGGLSVYNALDFEPLEMIERYGEIELVKKHVRR